MYRVCRTDQQTGASLELAASDVREVAEVALDRELGRLVRECREIAHEASMADGVLTCYRYSHNRLDDGGVISLQKDPEPASEPIPDHYEVVLIETSTDPQPEPFRACFDDLESARANFYTHLHQMEYERTITHLYAGHEDPRVSTASAAGRHKGSRSIFCCAVSRPPHRPSIWSTGRTTRAIPMRRTRWPMAGDSSVSESAR